MSVRKHGAREPRFGGRAARSVSAGVAALSPGETGPAMSERADARLYEAKRTGRNRVAA